MVDVNGDGRLDVVDAGTPGVAQIYLGNGDGTFSQGRGYVAAFTDIPYIAATIATADFNGDGKPDIATAGGVLLGNGDGTFQGIPYSSGFGGRIVIGDFEKSSKPDLGVLSAGSPSATVSIEHNNGDGTFSQLQTYPVPEGTVVAGDMDIVTGDVNGDGNLDLVVVGEDSTSADFEYSVLLGNGDGSFQAPVTYTPGIAGVLGGVAAIAPLRNDHQLDVLMLGVNLAVLLGSGDGTFASPTLYYPGGSNPGGSAYLLLGDFNGDGKLDAAISGVLGSAGTNMLYGNGDGTLQPALVPPQLASTNFDAFFASDLRNIGTVDLVGSNANDYQAALNNGDGTFTFLPLSYGPVAVADVNGDGWPDLFTVLASGQTCPIGVQLGNGDGTFGSPINLGCLPYPLSKLIADVNGDGRPDIVFPWGGGVAVLLNTNQPAAPDFSISAASGSSTSQTINAGQTASFTLAFAPTGSFTGKISLSCAVTPAMSQAPSCTLSGTSVQITGSGTQTLTLKVSTTAAVTSLMGPHFTLANWTMPLTWPLMFLGSAWLWAHNRKRPAFLAAPIVVLAFMFSVGCGGSGSTTSAHTTPGTPAGTYTATVTATSGSTTHAMALKVIVQ